MQKIMVLKKRWKYTIIMNWSFKWFWAYQWLASCLCLFPTSLYPQILLISFKLACKGLMGGKHLQNASGFLCKYFNAPLWRTEWLLLPAFYTSPPRGGWKQSWVVKCIDLDFWKPRARETHCPLTRYVFRARQLSSAFLLMSPKRNWRMIALKR